MIYIHSVSFALQDGVEAKKFFSALEDLCVKLKEHGISIFALQTATHDGSEIPNANLHNFRMVFASQENFTNYLKHPEHTAFAERAVKEWIQPESLSIINTSAVFRQQAGKPNSPVNRQRSYSF